jgi:hypothetical protein
LTGTYRPNRNPRNLLSASAKANPQPHINPKLLNIAAVEPRVDGDSTHTEFMNPAILLHEPRTDGSLILVGVENLVFLNAWHAAGIQAPPKLAGRTGDTMADDVPKAQDEAQAFGPHHDQHVYFKKMAKPSRQPNPFSPNVTREHHE